jgi:predicted protein tyrosine phosphatase
MLGRLTNYALRAHHAIYRRILRKNPPLDYQMVTDRIGVGAEIRTPENMARIAQAGFTHIISMQEDVDDGAMAAPHGIQVHWERILDDYEPKAPEHFARVIAFAQQALADPEAQLYFHCYAGVHRGPLMTLAVLRSLGHTSGEAQFLIKSARRVADFPEVYLKSLDEFFATAAAYDGTAEQQPA